jgi:hypothetical protein
MVKETQHLIITLKPIFVIEKITISLASAINQAKIS